MRYERLAKDWSSDLYSLADRIVNLSWWGAFYVEDSWGYVGCRKLRQPYSVDCDVRASSAPLVDWDHCG